MRADSVPRYLAGLGVKILVETGFAALLAAAVTVVFWLLITVATGTVPPLVPQGPVVTWAVITGIVVRVFTACTFTDLMT